MSSFLACRRFLHNKGVADTGTSEKSEVPGSIITRGMRQASNRAAKTVISLQCWDQESERGTVISALLATTTILNNHNKQKHLSRDLTILLFMVQFHKNAKRTILLFPFDLSFFTYFSS